MNTLADVPKLVEIAICELSRQLAAQGTKIVGLALCTDSGVSTLFHVFTTEFSSDDDTWANPNEWTGEVAGLKAQILAIGKVLSELSEKASDQGRFVQYVRGAFEALVLGLEASKPCLLECSADVPLLVVMGTDPGPKMAKMAISAVARLNAEALARRWAEALYPDYAV